MVDAVAATVPDPSVVDPRVADRTVVDPPASGETRAVTRVSEARMRSETPSRFARGCPTETALRIHPGGSSVSPGSEAEVGGTDSIGVNSRGVARWERHGPSRLWRS